ncbi:hypothetical protein [uncultured Brevundimonas sp.]|uniref:hypothetical protein n=1 Tax=uncultured Brevundimonas sp. TaxID=213418 RepID=UPI0030ED6F73|tara:strand:+ start:418 stop:846 length:429 start_codon:yes stop_codon:yes gene_type:complete
MNLQQMKAQADAWGGDLRRWPDDARAAAERLLDSEPVAAGRIVAEAMALDEVLHASPRPVPSAALRDRVIASAAVAGLRVRRGGRFRMDRLVLASGLGWAAAACAGIVVGLTLTTRLTADLQADAVLYQATLAGMDDTEVLG